MSVNEKMTAIADAIRKRTKGTEQLTLDDMATEITNVYNKGKQVGVDNLLTEFWKILQNWGTRKNYRDAFRYWDNPTPYFKPQYDIKPTDIVRMFYGVSRTQYACLDLREKQFKEKYGVEIDLSQATTLEQFLSGAQVSAVGTIDVTKVSSRLYYAFQSALRLQIIEKLILPTTAEPSMNTTNAFMNCNALTTIEEIEGLFGNSISFSSCPLDYDTIMRIINALADYSDGSYSKTLTLGTTNLAKLTDAEKAIATEKGWTLA